MNQIRVLRTEFQRRKNYVNEAFTKRVFCDKSFPRVHKLSPDDEKAFNKIVIDSCTVNEGALKPDF